MINYIAITNTYGMTLQLPLWGMDSGYLVHDVEGLGPVDAEIFSTKYAQFDGIQYQNAKRSSRNLVFTIGYSPTNLSGDISVLRKKLESLLRTKVKATFSFSMDDSDITWTIDGIVESNETTRFDMDPVTTISVICPDPDFKNTQPVTVSSPTFGSNISITPQGSEFIGFKMGIPISTASMGFTVNNENMVNGLETLSIIGEIESGWTTGYGVDINTNFGSRSVYQGGKSLLSLVESGSNWLQLAPGVENIIHISDYGTNSGVTTITYTERAGFL